MTIPSASVSLPGIIQDFRDDRIPVDDDPRHGSEVCLSAELLNGRAPVMTFFESVNRHRAIAGIDEPHPRHAGPPVGCNLHGPVISCCARRQNLSEPVRGAAHSTVIEFLKIAGNEDIWLHDGVNLLIAFGGLGQADVKGSNKYLPRCSLECVACLAIELAGNHLMRQ